MEQNQLSLNIGQNQSSILFRDYQIEAIDSVFQSWKKGILNPLIEMGTGLGKSLVIAQICKQLLQQYPSVRILMLVTSKELVEQNSEELLAAWPEAPLGIYCAGLNKKDYHKPIVFGTIDSCYKDPKIFGERNCLIIDECHRIPLASNAKFQKLFKGVADYLPGGKKVSKLGLTATPYRLGFGRIDGVDGIFDEVVYKYDLPLGVENGWLCDLKTIKGSETFDSKNVSKGQGDFTVAGLEKEMDQNKLKIKRTFDDIANRINKESNILLFTAGIKYARIARDELLARGISAVTVNGKMNKYTRRQNIDKFKNQEVQAITNANILTTGFNATDINTIIMLRRTLSLSLYVQMLGRGSRTHSSLRDKINETQTAEDRKLLIDASPKQFCSIIDYTDNGRRFGPINKIKIPDKAKKSRKKIDAMYEKGKAKLSDKPRGKICPSCGTLLAKFDPRCEYCGREFITHSLKPSQSSVMIDDNDNDWHFVVKRTTNIKPSTPLKKGSLRIGYLTTKRKFINCWLFFDHSKREFPYVRSAKVWKQLDGSKPTPVSNAEALERLNELVIPKAIYTELDKGFLQITKYLKDNEND